MSTQRPAVSAPILAARPWLALLLFHFPVLLWAAFCAWLLTLPRRSLGGHTSWIEPLEEVAHGGLILVLAWLVMRSLERWPLSVKRAAILAVVVSVSYAVILEAVQEWIPGRGWEWVDVWASAAGALVAALARRRLTRPSLY